MLKTVICLFEKKKWFYVIFFFIYSISLLRVLSSKTRDFLIDNDFHVIVSRSYIHQRDWLAKESTRTLSGPSPVCRERFTAGVTGTITVIGYFCKVREVVDVVPLVLQLFLVSLAETFWSAIQIVCYLQTVCCVSKNKKHHGNMFGFLLWKNVPGTVTYDEGEEWMHLCLNKV